MAGSRSTAIQHSDMSKTEQQSATDTDVSNKTVIPPVEAGTVNTEIEYEWDRRGYRGDYHLRARARHDWTFDAMAYHQLTGLDIGADYPYVPQENGHTLSVIREFRITEGSDGGYSVRITEKAVRGVTSYDDIFYHNEGSYDVENGYVTYTYVDNGDLGRPSEKDDRNPAASEGTARGLPDLGDAYNGSSPRQFVRNYHHGEVIGVPSVEDQLRDVIEMDSSDDAVHAEDLMEL